MRRAENSKLASRIDQQLNAYAVAASAAGVALLACSLPADARVICRTTSNSLLGTLTIPFNPANEKFPPFNLAQTFPVPSGTSSIAFYWNRAFLTPNTQAANDLLATNGLPAALTKRAVIGSKGQFGKGNSYGMLFTYGQEIGHGTINHHRGNFPLTKVGYLGFEFSISGQTHYGWARLRVDIKKPQTITKLLGFGYETTAGKAIHAGSCTTVDESISRDQNASQAATVSGSKPNAARAAASARKSKLATLGALAGGSVGTTQPVR
jgi:hypothetical protein